MPDVERVSFPENSLASKVFSKIDYTDSYRIQLPSDAHADLDSLYEKAFTMPSTSWVARLMRLRNVLVKPLGLKVGMPKPRTAHQPLQIGERAGLFKLFQQAENELLLGDDDKHLDFRVSVLRQHENNHDWLTITTVVHYNNWFGRVYFSIVRPFHAHLVPWMMKRAFITSVDQPTISTRPA